jgi:hypothetical protein
MQASISAIFNRCAAAHWCDAKGPQVCGGSLGKGRKKREKNWGITKFWKYMINIIFKKHNL